MVFFVYIAQLWFEFLEGSKGTEVLCPVDFCSTIASAHSCGWYKGSNV